MNNPRKGISAYQNESTKKGAVPAQPKSSKNKSGKDSEGFIKSAISDWAPEDLPKGAKQNSRGYAPLPKDTGPKNTSSKPTLSEDKINTGIDRASKFLMLLGKNDAAKVMRHLGKEEIDAVAKKIAETGRIDSEEASIILNEFGLIKEKGQTFLGGPDVAKDMLVSAFGRERGEQFFKRVVPHGGNKPFSFLDDYEFQQILMILKKEPPEILGIVLNYLEPATSSKILEALTSEQQKEVVKTIAVKRKIDSEVLLRMENVIKNKILKQGKVVTEEVDGKSILADILKHVNAATEQEILSDLDVVDPDLSEEIREKLFGIEAVLDLYDKDLQEVLRDYSDNELAFMLKGKRSEFQDKILTNISERRRELIEGEMSYLGEVKKKDVEKATKDFLRYLQTQVEEGKIRVFDTGKDEEYV